MRVLLRDLSSAAHHRLIRTRQSEGKRTGSARKIHLAEEMKIMARVEHSSPGFERERDDKDGPHHSEHGTRDAREARAEDSRDE